MFDIHGDAQNGCVGVDDRPDAGGRRRWSAAEKARIVGRDAAAWGACVRGGAALAGLFAADLSAGGTLRRSDVGRATRPKPEAAEFVPIVTDVRPADAAARAAPPAPVIEVRLAGAVVRVASGMDDAARLTAVLRAVRASASRP